MTALLTGSALATAAHFFYGVSVAFALALCATVTLAATNRVGCAFLQARREFGPSLCLLLAHNWMLVVAVPVTLMWGERSVLPVALTLMCAYATTSTVGWVHAWRRRELVTVAPSAAELSREALAVTGLQLGECMLHQLDRLLIPKLLSTGELGRYSVMATVAGSPFHMLQAGAGYTLQPRLRAAESRAAVLSLLRREALVLATIVAMAVLAVLVIAPWLVPLLFPDRYTYSPELISAILILGAIKVWHRFAAACAAAIGSVRQIAWLNALTWASAACAVLFATLAASHGVVAVVEGLIVGWLMLALVASAIAASALMTRFEQLGNRKRRHVRQTACSTMRLSHQ
jgi:O-antigen/teichoic acid export membrane protein